MANFVSQCEICGRSGRPAALKQCVECGLSFDEHCSALRAAAEGGYWAEEYQTFPQVWLMMCKDCFAKWTQTLLTCPSCHIEKPKQEIFWGSPCAECGDYVCYACVRAEKVAGGGWDAPQGLWHYKCKKHIPIFARSWRKIKPPG